MNVEFVADLDQLAGRGVDLIHSAMTAAIGERGKFVVALSGGNTPKPVYERLAAIHHSSVRWDKVLVYFGDERMVPCDSPESNYRMACESLLDRVDIPPWNVHRMQGELNANEAARLYNEKLRLLATQQGEDIPRFDLVLLGLGPDAHTASLFPDTDVLADETNLAAAVHLSPSSEGTKHADERLTMTYKVLNGARSVLFLVAGDDKADALKRVERGDPSAPAAGVQPSAGSVRWLVVQTGGG